MPWGGRRNTDLLDATLLDWKAAPAGNRYTRSSCPSFVSAVLHTRRSLWKYARPEFGGLLERCGAVLQTSPDASRTQTVVGTV